MSVNKPKRMSLLHRDSLPKNLEICLKTPKNYLIKVFLSKYMAYLCTAIALISENVYKAS